ncbi:hypothetical protein NGI13_22295 [Enterobacter asburiae]|uniref:FKBP-type peptidyl-prolyl cis-trans isomerase N-terminal domain-containing protein n=1 Tax=Enterobacter TaxID=547 RepID=UPI0004DB4633|nr:MULTISPECIES: FKBP-type peptidyl-prolyl cis-trans isomerase N-terminal domain-containing protein [Enterobacter]KFA84183.1 hypothetical protein N037_22200 [Enterobacter sp. EGD-HP1]MEB8258285.1 hypothetical protein [Enterobacter asburiae]
MTGRKAFQAVFSSSVPTEAHYFSGLRRRALQLTSLTLMTLSVSMSAARAESGAYEPPDNGVAGLMTGTGGVNDYGLGALMAQQGGATSSGGATSALSSSAPGGSSSAMSAPSSLSSTAAAARQAMRTQNRQLKAQVADLSAQVRALQAKVADGAANVQDRATITQQASDLTALRTQLSALTTRLESSEGGRKAAEDKLRNGTPASSTSADALKQAQQRIRTMTTQLTDSLAVQKAVQVKLAAAEASLATLRAQTSGRDEARTKLEASVKYLRDQLAQANERAAAAGKVQTVPLDSDMRKEAYVVGQAMAAGLREKLSGYTATGVSLDVIRVRAGLSDGLQEKMKLSRREMDRYWQSFADRLNKQVATQVKAGEALIASKVKGRKPDRVADGITYVVVKKGMTIKDDAAPVTLSLKEQVADGRVISQLKSLTLAPDDDMPAVVRNALTLLGEGAEVTAWAPAKVVYGDRPLPPGVMPFTVLEYHLTGLKAK